MSFSSLLSPWSFQALDESRLNLNFTIVLWVRLLLFQRSSKNWHGFNSSVAISRLKLRQFSYCILDKYANKNSVLYTFWVEVKSLEYCVLRNLDLPVEIFLNWFVRIFPWRWCSASYQIYAFSKLWFKVLKLLYLETIFNIAQNRKRSNGYGCI